MSDVWGPFLEVARDPLGWVRSWKSRTGGKVIGHLLPDVPEEIIHAAGGLPLALEGAGVAISEAQAVLPGYTCSHAMGLVEMGLKGELDFIDGLVIPYVCDTTRNLYHTWSHRFPDRSHDFLRLPKRLEHPGVRDYLRAEFRRLASSLGRITGHTPTEEDLSLSLQTYERSRAQLRRAYHLHRKIPSLWTGERIWLLTTSAMRTPREEHLCWMEALPWDAQPPEKPDGKVPIYVRGKVWDPPVILEMMDKLGLVIVADEMLSGFRSIAGNTDESQEPLDALISRHLSLPLYPGYHREPFRIVQDFLARVKGSGARGVLFLNPKFCEASGFDLPDLQKALEKEGIPSLALETSARGGSEAQIRVRLEAFREMIGEDLF
ncbi:MAG: 2-hydroxyacyl-CoA dehydratase subunit D [Thermodesulfobacteriota bacterium]